MGAKSKCNTLGSKGRRQKLPFSTPLLLSGPDIQKLRRGYYCESATVVCHLFVIILVICTIFQFRNYLLITTNYFTSTFFLISYLSNKSLTLSIHPFLISDPIGAMAVWCLRTFDRDHLTNGTDLPINLSTNRRTWGFIERKLHWSDIFVCYSKNVEVTSTLQQVDL